MHLGQNEFLKSIFFFDIFKKANKELGELKIDEVFGFFPSVLLGGEIKLENVKKVNLTTHLKLISQLSSNKKQK